MAGISTDVTAIGSAGYIVAAALETCGQYIQSQLLDVLASGLAASLGSLLYLLSAVTAITIYALGGQYKFSLWFFIGPALFFQCLFVRTTSEGAAWQFGNIGHDQQEVYDASNEVAAQQEAADGDAKLKSMNVASIFSIWNNFTSGIVQTTVSLLSVDTHRSDLHFVNQVKKYGEIMRSSITDPMLHKFVTLVTNERCSDYFLQQRTLHEFATDSSFTKENIKSQAERLANKVVFNKSSDPELLAWMKTNGIKESCTRVLADKFNSDGSLKDGQSLTCNDVWKLSLDFARTDAASLVERIIARDTKNEDDRKLAYERFISKFATRTNPETGQVKLFDGWDDGQKVQAMINELSVRMVINELSHQDRNVTQMNYIPKNLTRASADQPISSDLIKSMRNYAEYDKYQSMGDFLSAAQSLPYVQGLILFFLAASYPFFAFALLIPGRHHAMLLWMGLWFWAKSWDIGFALVMIIDDILYTFFPHGAPVTDEMAQEMANDPSQAFKAALEVDPTYSISVYYNLIAACMAAVPLITGVFIKTGGQEILTAINQGFRNFSGAIGGSIRTFMMSNRSQELAFGSESNPNGIDRHLYQFGKAHRLDAFYQPNVLRLFGNEKLMKLADSWTENRQKQAAAGLKVDGFADLEFKDKARAIMRSEFSNISKALTGTAGKQLKDEAIKTWAFNMKMMISNESHTPEIMDLGRVMAQFRANSHAHDRGIPGQDYVESVKAGVNVEDGAIATAFSNSIPGVFASGLQFFRQEVGDFGGITGDDLFESVKEDADQASGFNNGATTSESRGRFNDNL